MRGKPREYNNNILFEFDTLLDLQIGVVKALQEDFLPGGSSNPYLNYFFLKSASDEDLKERHVLDIENGLIEMCLSKDQRDSANQIYLDYIKEHYKRIIELSPRTDIVRLLKVYSINGYIKTAVVCRTKEEIEFVKSLDVNTTIVDGNNPIYLKNNYARIVISHITDILRYKDLECMHIAVLNYAENFTVVDNDRVIIPHFIVLLGDNNDFEIIEPYKIQELLG